MPIANWEQDYLRLWEEATGGQPGDVDPGSCPKPDQIKATTVSLCRTSYVALDPDIITKGCVLLGGQRQISKLVFAAMWVAINSYNAPRGRDLLECFAPTSSSSLRSSDACPVPMMQNDSAPDT